MHLVGRLEEQKILAERLRTSEAELIAVYGRRRVGKTYLIRTFCKNNIVFEFIGIHNAKLSTQLENFSQAIQFSSKSKLSLAVPKNWMQAFSMLNSYLDSFPSNKPAVIFFDEFPWIETHKSGFLQAFDYWWNAYASRNAHYKVIICGSAASWMINKIVNNKGGLHNRVTQKIRLMPFTLAETKNYLNAKNVKLDLYSLLQLYMAIGGIPHYLRNINPGESVAQIIDRLCFIKDGPLVNEFENLFKSLFVNSENHEKVVRALSEHGQGLTRQEIINKCGFTTGGTTSKIVEELEESGFITSYVPFQKVGKDWVFKLSDEYSMFFLKFIEHAKDLSSGAWLRQFRTPAYLSWCGFAFESICNKHIIQIKRTLGIEGVYTKTSNWRYAPGKKGDGAQIDLIIDRQDQCINICEIKFSPGEFVIDKKYAVELDNRLNLFYQVTGTKKTLFPTLITTYGTQKNEYFFGRVQAEVTMEDLFISTNR